MDRTQDPRLIIIRKHWYELHITQSDAAIAMGISQPCVNQYLHGVIKLNTDTVIKFAKLFEIAPSAIDSRIY